MYKNTILCKYLKPYLNIKRYKNIFYIERIKKFKNNNDKKVLNKNEMADSLANCNGDILVVGSAIATIKVIIVRRILYRWGDSNTLLLITSK